MLKYCRTRLHYPQPRNRRLRSSNFHLLLLCLSDPDLTSSAIAFSSHTPPHTLCTNPEHILTPLTSYQHSNTQLTLPPSIQLPYPHITPYSHFASITLYSNPTINSSTITSLLYPYLKSPFLTLTLPPFPQFLHFIFTSAKLTSPTPSPQPPFPYLNKTGEKIHASNPS